MHFISRKDYLRFNTRVVFSIFYSCTLDVGRIYAMVTVGHIVSHPKGTSGHSYPDCNKINSLSSPLIQ
jgi:hypothetical protein